MQAFDEAVGLRVIGRRGGGRDAQLRQRLAPGSRGELGASVGGNGVRDSEARDPVIEEGLENRVCRRVRERHGFWPAGGPVDHGQQVSEAAVG